MQWWSVESFIVFTVIISCQADEISVSPSPAPNPAAVNSDSEVVRQCVMTQDSIEQGDAVLKEQLKDSMTNLKELLQGKDSHLDERISDVLAGSKVQNDQLKEDHARDISWLKERLTKDLNYLKDQLDEGEVKTNKELSKLKEALGKRPCDVKLSGSAVMDDLRQQMTDIQAELKTHQETLQSTQLELESTRADLNTTRADLETTRADLQQKAKRSEEALQETRQQLLQEQQASTALSAQLQAAEQAIRSLKVEMSSLQSNYDLVSSEMGSTFTRWGRTTCPDNTSLVYSGYVGGQGGHQTGGGSNYLCLVKDPQLDNMTLPARYSEVYGTEYEDIEGHHEREALCSVCRAPQVTTLMIPATLSCPPGWTTQYRGHLVSDFSSNRGRMDYVCLDEVREHREGGHGEASAANMFHVVSQCDSLPCPPYAEKVVTCVVCSI